jgi:hypothetical protein
MGVKGYRDSKDTDLRLAKLAGVPVGKFKPVLEKAARGELSPGGAIRAKCLECTGLEDSVDRIKNCTCYSCPLHAYRPYQDKV